ncbi:MAG: hypothetical protein KHX03_05610 [Clostridium sp.]|nr:hypothetical protein [Clostridium sp.]
MEGISSNLGSVYFVKPEKENNHKALKHTINAAAVGAGVVATGSAAQSLCGKFDLSNAIKYNACNLKFSNFDKYHESISKFAEKIFPKNGKISKMIEKYAGRGFMTGGSERAMNLYKGKLAIVATAVAAALTLVGAGLYNAGKINGKNN